VFQVLCNISQRLLMLHDAVYVHGDLKPSNLLWLERLHAWTLIDFGCTAKEGVYCWVSCITAALRLACIDLCATAKAVHRHFTSPQWSWATRCP
jgi:tRNA A-37 threonylcarbamoyl transferase component Bud32